MRVISGIYKGKQLKGFDIDGTRPTMDRIKESMFAMIQNYLNDTVVLDLFAGSGALGIEALSNGSKECYFVDNNKIAIDIIMKNTSNIMGTNILKNNWEDALNYFKKNNIKFDIIILDPPYHIGVYELVINKIIELDLLNKDGIIVCETEHDIECNLTEIKNKKHGLKRIIIYKK